MKRRFLSGLLLIVALASAALWLRKEWKIDSCLNHGGRWDYQLAACEGA